MSEAYTDRQLALKLAVEALGERASNAYTCELVADQFYKYLQTGTMR